MDLAAVKGNVERRGNWMQTLTGGEFYPIDPRIEEIKLEDIAGALAKMCRYGGHCTKFYSVAEHSVLMAIAMSDVSLKKAALFHDASEAYLVDIPRPIKPFLSNYADIEDVLMTVIAKKFGFAWPLHHLIKELDNRILNDEREQAMVPTPRDWGTGTPLGIKLQFWSPEQAEKEFLDYYRFLTADV